MITPTRASARRRTIGRVLAGVVLLATLASCRPLNSSETYLYTQTNELRVANGLPVLRVHDQLVDDARSWAKVLAARASLAHSDPNEWSVSWSAVAENVGTAGSIETVVESLAASPPHLANMLSTKYTHTGIGTARGKDGRIYAVQLFWRG